MITPVLPSSSRFRPVMTALAALAAMPAVLAMPAHALEPDAGEEAAIKACEQRLCKMVLNRKPAGEDLSCAVAKTWDRDTLKKGESNSVKWGFGDARCAVDLDIKRKDVISALTKKEHTIQVPAHTVKCTVERDGKPKPVTAKLAPKLVFKDGKADKIWINLSDIDGPSNVKATVWMAAKLEDNLGIFHGSMIKSVNKFLHRRCGERYYADGTPKLDPKDEKRKKRLAKAAAKKAESKSAATPDEATDDPATTGSVSMPSKKPAVAAENK
jgi:hypothetical protein